MKLRKKILKFFNTCNNINKWWTCFVAWEQEDGTVALSAIPWHVLLQGIFGDTDGFRWQWVPPWKVKVGN